MTTYKHGITISMERIENHFYLSIRIVGKLTHADFERINPMIDSALHGINEPKIRVFVDCSELEGWELRAAWDDFKLSLKHGKEFEKVAIFSDKKWLKYSSKIASWFISGEVRHFEDVKDVLMWIQQ